MADDEVLTAWGDESARMRHNPPMYLMCASVFEKGSEEGLAELAKAKPAGMRKLHWYDMEIREKIRSLEAIARIPHWNTVAICSPMVPGPRQERARRKCLERMLPQLENRGVGLLTLESRWKQEDKSDVDMVYALRNRRMIEHIRVQHVRPDEGEVRLWIPDQILGAIGDMFVGAEGTGKWSRYWDEIDPHITLLMATLL